MKAVIGLGNPGRNYMGTRHNVGYEVVFKLAHDLNIDINKEKFKAVYGEGFMGGEKILLIQPITYMNLSGESVIQFVNFYKLPLEDIIVCCDDINLPLGGLRIRTKGSDGGQKGLRSIIYSLASEDFTRVRVGVGEKPKDWDLAKYVLSHFTKDEEQLIIEGITNAAEAVKLIIKGEQSQAMNLYNKKGIGN